VTKDEILTLFDYSAWANHRIVSAAQGLDQEQFTKQTGIGFGSLRKTLAHLLGAELVWLMRCQQGISPPSLPGEDEFPTLEAWSAGWDKNERAWRSYLAGLTDEDLERMVHFRTTRGVPGENPLWQLLLHLVNHGTQHRAEAAAMLTQRGCSPGDVDLIVFLRERRQSERS
jgi:uncharacterized damage-inducible protein DinB